MTRKVSPPFLAQDDGNTLSIATAEEKGRMRGIVVNIFNPISWFEP